MRSTAITASATVCWSRGRKPWWADAAVLQSGHLPVSTWHGHSQCASNQSCGDRRNCSNRGRIGLGELDPALLGANIVVSGLPDFSHVPPSSRLQGPDGTAFVVDMENQPCNLPARVIETAHSGHGKAFLKAAKGLRGVTAWVECEGVLRLKDRLSLHIPDQPVWRHLEAARAESNKFPIRH